MRRLDMDVKKTIFGDFGILAFKPWKEGKKLNFEKNRFSTVTRLQITSA